MIPARHRHQIGADPLRFKGPRRRQARPGPPSRWRPARRAWARRRRASDRRRARESSSSERSSRSWGKILAAEREQRRPVGAAQRQRPAFGGLDRVGGAEHGEIGDRAETHELLDRLVGRPVLAKPDRIVGHHINDADLLQRREPDRRPAIISEDQEGAAIGNHAAVQRHPVHRRGHAEFANAVIDITSGIIVFCECLLALCFGIVRTGEVGRAANRPRAGRR